MFELKKTPIINRLIAITKSDSGVSGPKLAAAHFLLGMALGRQMKKHDPTGHVLDPQDTTVVAILRGGIFFGAGLYFALGCRFELYDPKQTEGDDPKHAEFVRPATKNVILADSVINTGKTILPIMGADTKVACCVINEQAVPMFDEHLYAVRVSKNSFVGSNVKKQEGNVGPDTTERLFNLI